ncbi:MAG TPA: CHASE2 domain-containing protein, partial [Planctomycetota bacterium]|nr:CHASE2 domain-containing protein [Planctomycetota bacterium]
MKPTTLRRHGFRRAIERGDPRLGLFAGAAAALLAAALFAAPDRIGVVDRLELAALDLAFRHRTPVPESPELTAVDMDDNTFKKVSWPLDRKHHARAIWALDRLGARRIVMDVQFKTVMPQEEDYDAETGEPRLTPSDRFLRTAIGASGKVMLAYHLELEDPIGDLRPHFDRLKAAFARRIGASRSEIAQAAGLPETLLEGAFEACREEAVASLVADRLERSPDLTFGDLKRELLPDFRPGADRADLHLLHYAYGSWKARAMTAAKAGRVSGGPGPPGLPRAAALVPPAYVFLEKAAGVGCSNAEPDLDGVMRRPWAAVRLGTTLH